MDIPKEVLDHANQDGIYETYRNMYLRAWEFPKHYQKAIIAKCVECTGFEDSSNRIKRCTIKICPLWNLRHIQE